jgi:hypothetical protein
MKILLAALLGALCFQSNREPPQTPVAGPIAVEVAGFAFDGNRYHDGYGESIDRDVVVVHRLSGGKLDVTVGQSRALASTNLTFHFTHDGQGKTNVTAEAEWFKDTGPPFRGKFEGLRGLVVITNEDWGEGKSLTASFLLVGKTGSGDRALHGSFHFVNAAGDK